MNWLAKVAVQRAIAVLPASETVNYLFQTRVSRRLPIGDAGVRKKFERALSHLRAYREHGPARPEGDALFYEFGAGWDLAVPLAYAQLGLGRQLLVDIRPNLRFEQVNASIESLGRQREALEEEAGGPLRDLGTPDVGSLLELERRFGIAYLAPRDARATGLEDDSVDFVSSTNTLEHIPAVDLLPILRECARLVRSDGALSFRIDMQDHASYTHSRLGPHHFLRYSDAVWALLNSPIEYQNRLRLPDYRRLFMEADLDVVDEQVTRATEEQLAALEGLPVAPRFRPLPPEELAARALAVVLRPRSRD